MERTSRWGSRRGWGVAVVLATLAFAGAVGVYGATEGWSFAAVRSCQHFVTRVATSEPSYAPGQTVIISVTQANEGPVCTTPLVCGSAPAASAYNSAGEDVWDYGAGKFTGIPTCFSPTLQAWPAGYSNTEKLDWRQDQCAAGPLGRANPYCPGSAVPAGTYRIVGYGTSASATITISG